MEGGALPVLALEPDAAPLHFDQTARDIQTQACARAFAGLGVIRPEEFLEDFLLILGANANARISHPDVYDPLRTRWIPMIGGFLAADYQRTTLRRVLVGIADEIDEHLPQAGVVS